MNIEEENKQRKQDRDVLLRQILHLCCNKPRPYADVLSVLADARDHVKGLVECELRNLPIANMVDSDDGMVELTSKRLLRDASNRHPTIYS